MKETVKTYADIYLYGQSDYEKKWMDYFIKSTVLEKNTDLYESIRYEVKRMQSTSVLLKTLESGNVVLLYNQVSLPRAFKVFAAKDIKSGDKKTKVFIDMTDLLITDKATGNKAFDVKQVNILTSYLMSALTNLIYYADATKLINNAKLLDKGTMCFAELFTHVIDYLRLGGVDRLREKCMYLSSLYYQINILNKEYSSSIEARAKKISRLTDRDVEMLNVILPDDTFTNISTFIAAVAKVIHADTLRLDNFVEKWIFLYHSGTQFALELYPAFSTMITNAYGGAYLNNQKLIEKLCGRDMVDYTVALLNVGDELR